MSANALRAAHSGHRPKTMHSDVLDERWIEPCPMVIARIKGVSVPAQLPRVVAHVSFEKPMPGP